MLLSPTDLMERPKHRPRAQRLAISPKNLPRCLCTVDDNNWFVSQRDLVNWSKLLAPLAVLLRRIVFYVGDVADQRPICRAREAFEAARITYIFVCNDVRDRDSDKQEDEGAKRVFLVLLGEQGSNIRDHRGDAAIA
jgi:hypothetical protein